MTPPVSLRSPLTPPSGDLLERIERGFGALVDPTPAELLDVLVGLEVTAAELVPHVPHPATYPYGRRRLLATEHVEVIAMNWALGRECAPHDHGDSFGWIHVVTGEARHTLFTLDRHGTPLPYLQRQERSGSRYFAPRHQVHSMGNASDADALMTLHVYTPPIVGMTVYDLERCAACVVSEDCGAWWPAQQRQVVREMRLRRGRLSPAAAHVAAGAQDGAPTRLAS
jgi:cysteine dioxygenase